MLLSFAQFEREVIGERIRDKFAASRRKGMWMGGTVPFGYVVRDRKLVIHEEQAATVRTIFERFAKVGSATTLAGALAREGVLTPRGKPIDKGFLYKLLTNRVYVGEAVHKGTAYPGEHQAIVTRALWDKVHAVLQESPRKRAADTRASSPALLKGLIFGPTGCAMSPTHTRKGGRLYRYYVSQAVLKQGRDACPVGRLPAAEIEAAVIDQVRGLLRAPEIVVGTWRASKPKVDGLSEDQVRRALQDLDPLWDELFPAEQARIVQLLVERIDVGEQGFDLRLRVDGLAHLARDLSRSATNSGRQHEHAGADPHRASAVHHPQARRPQARHRRRRQHAGAAAAADRQHARQGARASPQVEQAPGERALQLRRGARRRREDQSVVHQPGLAVDAAGTGHRRGDHRRAACRRCRGGSAAAAVFFGLGGAASGLVMNLL